MAKLSQKHYVGIANAIKKTKTEHLPSYANPIEVAISTITIEIANFLASDNEKFDRELFYKACGYFSNYDDES